ARPGRRAHAPVGRHGPGGASGRSRQREMRERWSPSPDRLRQVRALEALELADGDEAGRVVGGLGRGMPGGWVTEEAKAARERRAKRPGAGRFRTGTSR